MTYESISEENVKELSELFVEMWPDSDLQVEYSYCKGLLNSKVETCFLAKANGQYIGFAYLKLRADWVEGTDGGKPVAYLEGIYVKPAFQKTGVGRRLVELGEEWGKSKGSTYFGSDVELDNQNSIEFHQHMGFEEANRVVCFAKKLD